MADGKLVWSSQPRNEQGSPTAKGKDPSHVSQKNINPLKEKLFKESENFFDRMGDDLFASTCRKPIVVILRLVAL